MEHNTDHKHVDTESMTPYQRFMHRCVLRLIELSTLELIVATLHLSLTAAVVFGLISTGHEAP